MIKDKFDAVIFDLDGTLVDSMWVWEKVDELFLGQLGIKVPSGMDKELEGKSFTETALYFKERFNLIMSVEEIKKTWNEMGWKFYTNEVSLKRGVREFLEVLNKQGVKIGIATSNSIDLVRAVLKALDIEGYFMQIRTSCEVGKGKPFPDIYLKVAEDLGVVPNRCLVFEDIPNGIRAAKNAGMIAWCIRDRQREDVWDETKKLADHNVIDYYEVIKQLT